MSWLLRYKWIAWLVAGVAAVVAALFGRRRGPTDEEVRLAEALRKEREKRAQEARDHVIEQINREVQEERDRIAGGGRDGFMDRAFKHRRAGSDDGR